MSRLNVSDRKSIVNLVREFGPGPVPPRRVEIGVRHGPDARNELRMDYDPGSAVAPADTVLTPDRSSSRLSAGESTDVRPNPTAGAAPAPGLRAF